ncbi:MAG: hypothetical protein Q4D29_11840 [Lachnospiraceae bacterium]|nr:hypothetical protein [Lachnospiraceae bacterium]
MIHKEYFKNRVVSALVLSVIIVLSSLISVLFMLDPEYQSKIFLGVENFKYYTTISNFLISIIVMLTIPFQIEGIKKQNYHLPNWVVNILYFGVGNLAIVFLATAFVIAPTIGINKALLGRFNFWQHSVSPLLSIILFLFVDKDHRIKLKISLYCMIPNVIYMIIYVVFAGALKNTSYAWPDVYRITKFGHYEIALVGWFLLHFLIINLVRVLHNIQHRRYKQSLEEYYRNSEDYKDKSIEEIIKNIALDQKAKHVSGDIDIPVHILRYYTNMDGNTMSLDDMCMLYAKYYFT